jgi:hypothetical protein
MDVPHHHYRDMSTAVCWTIRPNHLYALGFPKTALGGKSVVAIAVETMDQLRRCFLQYQG